MSIDWESKYEAAQQRDPRTCKLGFFGKDDGECGPGGLVWFTTLAQFKLFVATVLPTVTLDQDADDDAADDESTYSESCKALRALLQPIRTVDEISIPVIKTINGLLIEQSIQWVGTFDTLCNSDDEWCAQVREQFTREPLNEDTDEENVHGGPILPTEVEGFLEYLKEYGF